MNLKIKFRESFRPFAPCRAARARPRVVRDAARRGLAVHAAGGAGPRRAPASRCRRGAIRTLADDPDLVRRVDVVRSTVPAITHVDYSARVQTVDERHGRYPSAAAARSTEQTGCPVLVNTSFNLSWEPIVLTPEEAYHTFMQSEMDVLVLEDFVLHKARAAARLAAVAPRTAETSRAPRQPVGRSGHRRSARRVTAAARAIRATGDVLSGGGRHSAAVRADRSDGVERRATSPRSSRRSTRRHRSRTTTMSTTPRALLEKARAGTFARLLNEQIPYRRQGARGRVRHRPADELPVDRASQSCSASTSA